MRDAIEHAGAERGLLIFPQGVEQRIEAEAATNGETIIVRLHEAPASDSMQFRKRWNTTTKLATSEQRRKDCGAGLLRSHRESEK
jgi:hypothetical protein